MFKKILLPISAIAMMSLMACAGSEKKQAQVEPQANNAGSVNMSASASANSQANGGMSDEEIAAALAAQQAALAAQANGAEKRRGLLSSGGPDEPMPATCEIVVDNATELQAKFDVKDMAIVTMSMSVVDNAIKSVMNAIFKENISQDEIANECEITKSENPDESVTVVCEGNSITATENVADLPPEMFGMAANMVKQMCEKTQQSGFLNAETAAQGAPAAAPADGLKIDCNVDMNSNEWTVNVNGINMKYAFEGNTVKQIMDIAQDLGSPEMCQMAVNAAKQEDASIGVRCEGSVMKMQTAEILDDTTKEELYQNMKPLCPSK